MGRGSKVGFKRTRVQREEKGSDESDEEYKLEEDEEYDESDDYCSLDTDESEELLADFEKDEEEDEEEKNAKRVVRSKPAQKCSRQRKMNQVKKAQKKKRVSPKVEDDEVEEKDDDYEVEDEDESENEDDQKCSRQRKMNLKKPQIKRRVSPKLEDDEVEDEDDDYEVEDEDEDEAENEDDQNCFRQIEMNQVKKPQRKRSLSPRVEDDEVEDKDDDYEVEDDDEDEAENEDDLKYSRQRKMNQVEKPQRKRSVSPKLEDDEVEEKDDDYEVEGEDEDEDDAENEDDQKCSRKRKLNQVKKPQRKRGFLPKVEDDVVEEKDDDYEIEDEDDDDDDDDEEFMLDESDDVDEEDEMLVMKKIQKVGRSHLEKRGLSKGEKRSRKSKVLKKPTRQISRKNRRFTKTTSSDEFTNKSIVVQERSRNTYSRKKRRTKEDSDSDFINPVSDFEYTISEEEREQVREATKFCTNFNTSLRSSSSMKRLQEDETVCPQRRRTRRKGKEKVVDMKNEVIKQVCGICLSEEGKKTVQGSLDCCSHYFCFACIMEWSKVESRCPLCKQRFMTISKPARSITGLELRTAVIQIPERDQVYQPSEEELQGYLDPYENVICTECQQGGEDDLMLLCDICDSPAHTFCVGLGREVPEGNWYCDGCRPAAFASLNAQSLSPMPDQRANNMSGPSTPFPRGIDLNAMYVPETPLTQETRNFRSFRRPMGDHHAASPVSGTGAVTVLDRRRTQLQINSFILNNRMSQAFIRSNGISASTSSSGIRVFGAQLDQGRALTPQQTTFAEIAAPLYSNNEGRLEDNTFTLARNRDLASARTDHFSGQVQNQTFTSADRSLQAELGGFGMAFIPSLVHEQLHPGTSRTNIGADASLSPYACREAMVPSQTSQGSLRTPF